MGETNKNQPPILSDRAHKDKLKRRESKFAESKNIGEFFEKVSIATTSAKEFEDLEFHCNFQLEPMSFNLMRRMASLEDHHSGFDSKRISLTKMATSEDQVIFVHPRESSNSIAHFKVCNSVRHAISQSRILERIRTISLL